MKKRKSFIIMLVSFFATTLLMSNSDCTSGEAQTNSGVKKATVEVTTDANGNTVEQKAISKRVVNDNRPGAIKHLYVISPYSGQTILYSTVTGKVTSSGKRLQPKTVHGGGMEYGDANYIYVGGREYTTDELIQDDGTVGDSDPYIYWWDVRDVYHQHFMTGGQIIHVSDQPLNVKSVIINIEQLPSDEG